MAMLSTTHAYKRLFFLKKSRLYKQSKKDFYTGKNLLTSSSSFGQIFKNHRLESQQANKSIKFYGLEFGSSTKTCRKRLGKPNYIERESSVMGGLKAYFYRLRMKGIRCILQIHFYQDQFFFGQMEIREGNTALKNDINKLLCEKYGIETGVWHGTIADKDNNQLIIKEDTVPNITYVTGDQVLLQDIRQSLIKKLKTKDVTFNQRLEWLIDAI